MLRLMVISAISTVSLFPIVARSVIKQRHPLSNIHRYYHPSMISMAQVGSEHSNGSTSAIWKRFTTAPDTPDGFTLKTAWSASNPAGATTILEQWTAGSAEPPHSHPCDDMTVVIEGKMEVQFFIRDSNGRLQKDGTPLVLRAGETGYIAGGRIHDAKYVDACKLVYVHDAEFGFQEQK